MKNNKKRNNSEFEDNDLDSQEDEDYEDYEDNQDYEDNKEMQKLKKDKKLYSNFLEIKKEIKKTEPNIINILKEPLLLADRTKLLLLYEIYKISEPSTENWFEQRNNINKLFQEAKNNYIQYSKYTEKQHIEMNTQISILNKYDPIYDLQYKILLLNTSIENKQIIFKNYKEFISMHSNDDEKGKLKNWLYWATSIPYDNIKCISYTKTELTNFLKKVSNTLDEELYGMKSVKEQILLFVSAKIQNPHMKKCSLGFVGDPGVGKTHISKLLAKVLDFPFEQISFGGVSNPEFLKGHEYTYIGAQPGEIVKCLKRMNYKNGILFLDEFDKISNNPDICSALLHITDPVQNFEFRDNFLSEITIDLSYMWFVYSMNKLTHDTALNDRIYTIEVSGYTSDEKIIILSDYLLPRALKNINIPKNSILMSKQVSKYLVSKEAYKEASKENSGVRQLEKIINNIVNKLDFIVKHQDKKGNLTGFDMSFNLGVFIQYPLTLTIDIINKLI